MEKLLFSNNAVATMSGTLAQGGTSLNLAAGLGELFPAPATGEAFLLTLYELDGTGNETRIEIAKCTARTADNLTIERDVEGTVGVVGGYSYPSSVGETVYVELRWTAAGADEMLQANQNLADLASASAARGNLGLGTAATKNVGTGAGDVLAGNAVTVHEAAADPHHGYLTPTEANAAYAALWHTHVGLPSAWTTKTGAYNVAAGDRLRCDTSGGGFMLTLAASPTDGDQFSVLDYAGTFATNNLLIDANGKTICGASTFNIDLNHFASDFVFCSASNEWRPA